MTLAVSGAVGTDAKEKPGNIAVTQALVPLPGFTNPPTDPDGDGLYEDLNADGELDSNDVQLFFREI